MYEKDFREQYEKAGIWYEHRLIDDMVAQVMLPHTSCRTSAQGAQNLTTYAVYQHIHALPFKIGRWSCPQALLRFSCTAVGFEKSMDHTM